MDQTDAILLLLGAFQYAGVIVPPTPIVSTTPQYIIGFAIDAAAL